ncbi:uncharacterized protein [Penaeus vannamei]|uniref:uncharacterized protein n=1 Tax=Penaeus vannamei TaxID=6689 RepID=UPI00387F8E2C
MMKLVVVLFALAAVAAASDLKESPRFGYLSLDPTNGASLAFNSTTINNGIFFSVLLFVAALAVKLFIGYDFLTLFEKPSSYENQGYTYDPAQAYSNPSVFAKKSLDMLSPVLDSLSNAYQKYQ